MLFLRYTFKKVCLLQDMVPRSELLATEARCRKLEASAKKDSELHQTAWDALNDRLKAAVEESESMKSAMQVSW